MVLPGLISTLPVTKDIKKLQPKSEAQLSCEAKGGRWDEENQVCILPEPPTPEPTPPPGITIPAGTPETFSSSETGRASGITTPGKGTYHIPTGKVLPDGSNETKRVGIEEYNVFRASIGLTPQEDRSTFLGLSPEDVSDVAAGEAARVERPAGTQEAGVAAQQVEESIRLSQAIGKIGELGQLNPAVQADINFSQALTAGGARVLPAALGGAAVGAAAGAVTTGGLASLPAAAALGILGAGTGFVTGVMGNIKEQQRGELQAADVELSNGIRNMRQLAMLASQDPSNADIYVKQYNDQLTRIHQSRRQTKAEVTGNLNSFMEDGREQLADFDSFLQPGGTADIYGQKLTIALNSGAPLSINGEDLLIEEGLL